MSNFVINPYYVTPSGEWNEYENTSTETIPTNSQDGRITYDTGETWYKFIMSCTTSISYGTGNWNGSVLGYGSNMDKGAYYSPATTQNWIGSQFHRHNSGNTESEHGAHDPAWTSSTTCNTNGGNRVPYNLLDWGCSNGIPNGNKNWQIEYDGDSSGGTAYWREFNNGFGSAATLEQSWTIPSMSEPFRYFVLTGRWNGNISASVSYRKFEWFA